MQKIERAIRYQLESELCTNIDQNVRWRVEGQGAVWRMNSLNSLHEIVRLIDEQIREDAEQCGYGPLDRKQLFRQP